MLYPLGWSKSLELPCPSHFHNLHVKDLGRTLPHSPPPV